MRLWHFALGLALVCTVGYAEDPPLKWAADMEGGAPYIYRDTTDPEKLIGFEVEIAEALSRELNQGIEHKHYSWVNLMLGLEKGDFDFAMNGIESTPDRQANALLTRPYYVYTQQLVVRNDDDRFQSYEDIKKLPAAERGEIKIGTLGDTVAQRMINADGMDDRVYQNQTEPYLDLENGRTDAVLLDLPIAVAYARDNPKLKFLGEPFAKGYYSIAVSRENAELHGRLDQAVGKLIESGELKRILEKWGIWNAAQEELVKLDRTAVAGDIVSARGKFSWNQYFPILCGGALMTIKLSFASMAFAVLLGLPIAVLRLYGPTAGKGLAIAYVEFFRGIPVLMLLITIYYGAPVIGEQLGLGKALNLSAFTAAVLAFGLNYAAYESEIYRAGISGIPVGQWEAAASLGMSPMLTFRRIILPQSLRGIIPPMTNDFVALFKDTSLVSVIALEELTTQYSVLTKSSLQYFEIGMATALLYLVMSVPLGHLSRYLEKKWSAGN